MGNDIDKAIELLMTMLKSKEEDSKPDEEYNEISEDSSDENILSEDVQDGMELAGMLGAFSGGNDKRVALLSSIKPYMNQKRQGKVDAAINLVRVMSVSSGLGLNKLFDIK